MAKAAIFIGLLGLPLAAKAPDWVRDVIKEVAAYEKFEEDSTALVLHHSLWQSFREDGSVRSRHRKVIHFRTADERDYAHVAASLRGPTDKVIRYNAWMLYASGRVESFGRRDAVEVAQGLELLRGESKSVALDRSASVAPGAVFAYEYETTSKSSFPTVFWVFQTSIPTVYSSLTVERPTSWTSVGYPINGDRIQHLEAGVSETWEASYMPPIKEEPNRPPVELLVAQVGVSLFPDNRSARSAGLRVFETWTDVARYGDEVQRAEIVPDELIASKARELTRDAATPWEAIRSICEYTQSLNYVAIEIDLNTGGGYRPQAARDVLRRHYGDCKDMTALTRSLLRAAGVDSYAVLASVGSEAFVHDQWPTPQQFNHCIVGIAAPPDLESSAIIESEGLGRILIFDPTQRFVPVGALPGSLQGTRILVADESSKVLLQLPLEASDQNRSERRIKVEISQDGTLAGVIVERVTGTLAESLRAMLRKSSEKEFGDFLRSWISRGARDVRIEGVKTTDDFRSNTMEIEIDFVSPFYVRSMGADMLVFNPVFLSRHRWTPPVAEKRSADYVFQPWSFEETVEFAFPAGFALSELYEPVEREAEYGRYRIFAELGEKGVVLQRALHSGSVSVSPEGYSGVVGFFDAMSRYESRPFVLKKLVP